ncbi:MAG: alpha-hydroxy-acid oxidizing protein [Asgard group archaeon]|nr:alpha-hydroxy-acid oxidizing protein [Asgard group archaeon]
MELADVHKKARNKLENIRGAYVSHFRETFSYQEECYGHNIQLGGAGSGAGHINNLLALRKIKLKMKVIGSSFEPETKTMFFGNELSMPIMAASVAGISYFGGEKVISEKDFCRATVLGCKEAGTISFRGDNYTYSTNNLPCQAAIKEADGFGVKIFKPRSQENLRYFISKYKEINPVAIGIDVDGFGDYEMNRHEKPVYRKNVEEIKELVASTKKPFIIKGVMTVEDAEAAVDGGAAAIVVSNHGGRMLDHTPGTAEVLPDIVKAVKGKIKILVDGGVRNGYDAIKMLALGAEGVLVGREIIKAAVGGGIEGVRLQMNYMHDTLQRAMKLTNCRTLKDIKPNIIYKDENNDL